MRSPAAKWRTDCRGQMALKGNTLRKKKVLRRGRHVQTIDQRLHVQPFTVTVPLMLPTVDVHSDILYVALAQWVQRHKCCSTNTSCVVFTKRCSVAKSVGCFQRHLFVCVFVCQQNNFRTSKHRMMKLGVRCIVQKPWPSSNLGVIAP